MLTKIIEQIKTGRIKNVIPYGYEILPSPPYVVVKPERDGLDRGVLYRIITHMKPGQQIYLRDYVFSDLSDLLDNHTSTSRNNNYNILLTENDYTDIVVSNDDGTISMERVFLMPSRIF